MSLTETRINAIELCYPVFVDAGSRYEVDYLSGVTHFLSKTAMQVRGGGGGGEEKMFSGASPEYLTF